jgi:hypothetical protein
MENDSSHIGNNINTLILTIYVIEDFSFPRTEHLTAYPFQK